MPMVAAAVGTAVAWVGGITASAGALITSSLSAYAGISVGTAAAISAGIGTAALNLLGAAAVSALMAPSVGRGGSPIQFKADPAAPISGVMGRFGVGGRQVHANTWGKDNLYLSFAVALSLGPIQSIEAFTANGVAVTFPGAQGLAASVEPYKDKMWQTRRLGLPTDAYLSPPTGVADGSPAMTEWTSAHTLPGFAHAFWTLKNNSKRASYESGVPAPIWLLHGMKLWDPRLDSTYPGGSGSQRRDDWTTWGYTEDPYLHALAWVRGHHKLNADGTIDTTKRLAGVGAPDSAIDIAAFVEGANVCDANSWTISGEWTTVDDKWQVLAAMLQAGGGVPLNRGAQISCMVEAPRTSLLTLTGEDIVGSVSLNVMASRRDRPNTIVPRVRLEAQKFEEVALGAVTSATYVTEDGGETRTREVPYRYVGLAQQGAELAAYGLANARETLKASIPCKPHLLGLRAGDAFTVTEPELGLSGQKFVVLRRAFDPSTCIVTLDVRSETDAKHAWALGQTADPPETPSLSAVDPIPTTPVDGDWTVVPRPAEAGGIQQPGFIVSGSAVGDNVGAVQIEVGATAVGPWEQAYHGPPTTEEVPVNGLNAGAVYYVAVTYWSLRAVPSEKLVKGPYTAPGLVAGDVTATSPVRLETINRMLDEVLARADMLLAEQNRRRSNWADAQRFIDRIGVVNPATGRVDLRSETVFSGSLSMATVDERVGSGLANGGFISKPIPRRIAEASNAHNGQLELSADGELMDAVGTRGQVTIPGMGIDIAIDYSVGSLENDIISGSAPTGAVAYGAALKRDAGPQGGRLFVEKPLTGSSMTGDLLIDLYGDTIRIADASTLDGFFLDMSEAGASITARIWHSNNVPTLKTALALNNVDNVQQLPLSYLDTDGALAANSDTKVASQKAVKTYVDSLIGAQDAMVFKGVIDCSANPNYPAADKGWTYRVSVTGKIGGGSGVTVEVGDFMVCLTDGTSSGDHATVGANWSVIQVNLDGAVVGPASSTSGNIATFNGAGGKVIQDGGKALPSGAVVGTTDTQTLTNKTLTAPAISLPTGIVKGDVGLGNVDDTSDANKPVSTAQQSAIDLKAAHTNPVLSLPTYADNAAAVTGGLAADALYKTATGEVRIRV